MLNILAVNNCQILGTINYQNIVVGYVARVTTVHDATPVMEILGFADAFVSPIKDILISNNFSIEIVNGIPTYVTSQGKVLSKDSLTDSTVFTKSINELETADQQYLLQQFKAFKVLVTQNAIQPVSKLNVSQPKPNTQTSPQVQVVNQQPPTPTPYQAPQSQQQQPVPVQQSAPQQSAPTPTPTQPVHQYQNPQIVYSDSPDVRVGMSGIHSKLDRTMELPMCTAIENGIPLFGNRKEREEDLVAYLHMYKILQGLGENLLDDNEIEYLEVVNTENPEGTLRLDKFVSEKDLPRFLQAAQNLRILTTMRERFVEYVNIECTRKKNTQQLRLALEKAIAEKGVFSLEDVDIDLSTLEIKSKDGEPLRPINVYNIRSKELKETGTFKTVTFTPRVPQQVNVPQSPTQVPQAPQAVQVPQQAVSPVQVPQSAQQPKIVSQPQQQTQSSTTQASSTQGTHTLLLNIISIISTNGKTVDGVVFVASGTVNNQPRNGRFAHSSAYMALILQKYGNIIGISNDINYTLENNKFDINPNDFLKIASTVQDVFVHPSEVTYTGLFKNDTVLENMKTIPKPSNYNQPVENPKPVDPVLPQNPVQQPSVQPPSVQQPSVQQPTQPSVQQPVQQPVETTPNLNIDGSLIMKLKAIDWSSAIYKPVRQVGSTQVNICFTHDVDGIETQSLIPLDDIVKLLHTISESI